MSDEIESVCAHCGVPIMQITFLSGQHLWHHVPNEGPIYLRIQCELVATPSDSRSADA